MTKGTVSQTLQALQRKGLVSKSVESDDRRAVRLQLTASGHSLLNLDPLLNIAVELAKMPELSPGDVTTGLQAILTALLKARGGRPFGVCRTCRHFNTEHPKGRPNHCDLLQEPLSQGDANDICVEQTAA